MLCDSYFPKLSYQESLLAKYYSKLGLEVVVIASSEIGLFDFYKGKSRLEKKIVQVIDGIKIYRLPYKINLFNRIRIFKGVTNIIMQESPDFIFVHDIHFNLHDAVRYKNQFPDCKLIIDFHSDYVNSGKNFISLFFLHYLLKGFYLRFQLNYLDKIYSIVPGGIDFMEQMYLVNRNRIELFPLGFDVDLIKPLRSNISRLEMREHYNIPEDAICIFSGGRFSKSKKIHNLIETMFDLPKVYLLLAGDFLDDEREYKETMLSAIAANKRIIFCGWKTTEEMYKVMSGCDFAVFPGSQTVLWQQSLGLGLPLVITKYFEKNGKYVDQKPEYLAIGKNVQIIDGRTDLTTDMIQAIKKFLSPIQLCDARYDALKFADEHLSYEALASSSLHFDN